jgi:hypothetical protein
MSNEPNTSTAEVLAEAMADSWMGEQVDCADVGTILAPAVDQLLAANAEDTRVRMVEAAYRAVTTRAAAPSNARIPVLGVELHDVHCRAGDWPHAGECVSFEGYEAVANPLLSVLASHGYATRADVGADWQHLAPRPVTDAEEAAR